MSSNPQYFMNKKYLAKMLTGIVSGSDVEYTLLNIIHEHTTSLNRVQSHIILHWQEELYSYAYSECVNITITII